MNQVENINRADLLREMMFHDSDASGLETVPSRTHHDLDLTGQLALGRPMLVAEIDRPGTRLVLGATHRRGQDRADDHPPRHPADQEGRRGREAEVIRDGPMRPDESATMPRRAYPWPGFLEGLRRDGSLILGLPIIFLASWPPPSQ